MKALMIAGGLVLWGFVAQAQSEPPPCDLKLPRGMCIQHTYHHNSEVYLVCRNGHCADRLLPGESDDDIQVGRDSIQVTYIDYRTNNPRKDMLALDDLERDVLEAEAHDLLVKDLFQAGLEHAERGLALKPDDDRLAWERVAALYGLGRIDEGHAAWLPLAQKSVLRAYAAAATYGVLRKTLDDPEIAAHKAKIEGTARIHADGRFAVAQDRYDRAFAVSPSGDVAVIENSCYARATDWMRIGDVRVPLGMSEPGSGDFHETGVTVANRLLHDRGFTFPTTVLSGRWCDDNVMWIDERIWIVVGKDGKGTLSKKPPRGVDPAKCTIDDDDVHELNRGRVLSYAPSLGRWFELSRALRQCGDGGTDPVTWQEGVVETR